MPVSSIGWRRQKGSYKHWDQIGNKKKPNFSSKVAQKLAIKA